MRRSMILLGAAAGLAACGQSSDESAANQAAANAAAAANTPKPAFCFFKDTQTKGWAARRDKAGNVVVTGKAYREDPRYKAVLGAATVTGTSAEIAPSITVNDTGFAARDNWWDVSATIPNSAAVGTVRVTCGGKTVAELTPKPAK
jgi:hypothetical protein